MLSWIIYWDPTGFMTADPNVHKHEKQKTKTKKTQAHDLLYHCNSYENKNLKKDNFVWIQLGSTILVMSDLFLSAHQKVVKTKEEH